MVNAQLLAKASTNADTAAKERRKSLIELGDVFAHVAVSQRFLAGATRKLC